MSIGHDDPALHSARQLLAQICECGEYDSEHSGRRKTPYAPPDGPCGATGCTCPRFRKARLVVSRVDVTASARRGKRSGEKVSQ